MAKTSRGLDRTKVIEAAVQLVNDKGINELTISSLAESLHIQPPSLYNHISGLQDLQNELALVNSRLMAQSMSDAAIGKSGKELFVSVAQAFRNHVKRNAGLYLSSLRSSMVEPLAHPELSNEDERIIQIGLTIMKSIGLLGEDAVHGLRGFRSVIHGFASLEIAGGFGLPQDCDESFRRVINALFDGMSKV